MSQNNKIVYKLDNNVFVPYCTGVVVAEHQIGDAYSDVFAKDVAAVIDNAFAENSCFTDNFKELGLYSYDYSFLPEGQHTVYRFFNIECEENKYAVFCLSSGTAVKLWINYKLYSLFGSKKRACVVALKKGNNCIVMEAYKASAKSTIFLRVSDYERETNNEVIDSLFCSNMYPIDSFGHLKYSSNHLYDNNNIFEFAFYPENDIDSKSNTAEIEISDIYGKKVFYSNSFPIGKRQQLDLSDVNLLDEDDGNTICAKIKYEYNNGSEFNTILPLYKNRTEERLRRLSSKALEMLNATEVTEYDQLALMQGYEYINKYGRELSAVLAQSTLLRNNIISIQQGTHLEDSIRSPGVKKVFFYNKMYNAVNYYWMYVPKGYNEKNKYPLVVVFSTLEYNDRSKFFEYYTNEDVIVVDVSMRGMTLGSYIGETAIQYALEDIIKKFSIDLDRIYCTGTSNGAAGVWAQLEMFPDRYAGGYPVSGNSNINYLCNTYNVGLILLASNADYLNTKAFEIPKKHLDNEYCLEISANMLSHQLLEFVWFKKAFFEKLLTLKKNNYPSRVIYKTMSNRHLKAYWVEIHSIEYGCAEGSISAEIKCNEIEVKCEGITGFTLYIPPQVQGKRFCVTVNGEVILFLDENVHDKLFFVNKKNGFVHVEEKQNIKEKRKGFGLLDVYMDPLSIVTPPNPSNYELNTVTAYSEPYCNSIIPRIYVKYPVIDYNELNAADYKADRSYVVIDNGEENSVLSTIRAKATVKYDNKGWSYNGSRYVGKYCVQQIIESPWNPENSIHLISYNDESMLNKNIFTRKLVIPSYSNGRHKYLNNMILIYDEDGYSGAIDTASDIIKI